MLIQSHISCSSNRGTDTGYGIRDVDEAVQGDDELAVQGSQEKTKSQSKSNGLCEGTGTVVDVVDVHWLVYCADDDVSHRQADR